MLKIAWATQEAAVYACKHWHYSGRIPVNKLVRVGAWENDQFIGVIVFGLGASARLHEQFSVDRFEVCELVRVALTTHHTPVSRIIRIALKFLRSKNPGLKICVSFADPNRGHHGGIYQAGNWIYLGKTRAQEEFFYGGRWRHASRAHKDMAVEQYRRLRSRKVPGKFRYVMVFDPKLKEKIKEKSLPYPKRVDAPEAEGSKRSRSTGEVGGSSPTSALQKRLKKIRRKADR